jgi:lycopene elongase/hydratase (dihydrobisanhydrobacterioruberin-forming)
VRTRPAPATARRPRSGTGQFVLDLCAIARPWFWPVSLLPYYVGVLLATHRLFPSAAQVPRLLVGALVVEPLVWLAVLAINDAHDLPGDLRNPRKANTPLTSGRLSPNAVRGIAYGAAFVALAVSLSVGAAFAAGALLALALGWLYSTPPVRLKARPGADVAANGLALGALGPLAGWTAAHQLSGFPWAIALQGVLVGAALYVPTTLADYPADLAVGYRTVAVRLGPRVTYRLGFAAWTAAAVLSVVLAATGTVIPRRMLPFEAVTVPGLVLGYHLLLRRHQSVPRIAAVSFLFLVPSAIFALTYTHVL